VALSRWDAAGCSPATWDRAHSLTGNWGGWRSYLEDEYGVFVLGSYTAEVAGNPVGGQRQGVRYTHKVGLALLVDLEKFAGIPATRFIASASERTGESNSLKDIGNIYAVQQLYGGQTTRLVQLALGTQLFDGALDVVAGRVNGLDDFAASPLYCLLPILDVHGRRIPTDDASVFVGRRDGRAASVDSRRGGAAPVGAGTLGRDSGERAMKTFGASAPRKELQKQFGFGSGGGSGKAPARREMSVPVRVLCVNSGSSSLKVALYEDEIPIASSAVEGIGSAKGGTRSVTQLHGSAACGWWPDGCDLETRRRDETRNRCPIR
jgi:hypothetical protein